MSRYDLLMLAKRAGRLAGFTPRLIQLLEYYMAFTTEKDWEGGASPIVFQSLAKTSLELGVSERQIQRMEKKLCDIGALTWRDSGNHKRFGRRCEVSGHLLFAFGVDLSPLAALTPKLRKLLTEKDLQDKAWIETKRTISAARRGIKRHLAHLINLQLDVDAYAARYDALACPIRTHISLAELRALLREHNAFLNELDDLLSVNMSSRDDESVAHIKYQTNPKTDKSDSCKAEPIAIQGMRKANPQNQAKPAQAGKCDIPARQSNALIVKTGLQNISLSHIIKAASERFIEGVRPSGDSLTWKDLVETAYQASKALNISDASWRFACSVLGRNGAAICVVLTDRGIDRDENAVRNPKAYFSAMISRAREGELNLDNAIFGILHRQNLLS